MKINWKVRIKNPYFWIGLVALFFCAMGIDAATLTSWAAVLDSLKAFITNPYMIVTVIIALIGYIQDPTTKGLGDSDTTMTYTCPRKDLPTAPDDMESEVK